MISPEALEKARAVVRQAANEMLKQNIQWRLDPRYILAVCDEADALAALKKEAADVVRPFAEMPLEGTFGGPLCGAKGLYEDGSEPEYNPDRSILGREPFCAARSFLDTLERRDG